MKNLNLLPTDQPSRLLLSNKGNLQFLKDNSSTNPNNHFNGIYQHIYITNNEVIKEGVDQWYLDKVLNEPYNSGGAQYSSKQDVIILTTDQDLIKDGVQAIDDEFLEWFVKNPSCESVETSTYHVKGDISGKLHYKIIIPSEPKQEICIYCNNKGYIGNHTGSAKIDCLHCNIVEEPNPFELPKALPDDVFYESLEEPKQETLTYTEAAKKEERIFNSTMMSKQETLEEAAEKTRQESFMCCSLSKSIVYVTVGEREKSAFINGAKWQAERMYSEEEVKRICSKAWLKTPNTPNMLEEFDKWFEQFKKK